MSENPIQRFQWSQGVEVSIVIPHFYGSREENLTGLVEDLRGQTFKDLEILVVSGISPQGKAINQGVQAARGKILVIMDDDSRLGHSEVIQNLVRVIQEDPSIWMVGASLVTSEKANWFQKIAGRQFPRFHMSVVKEVTESDLPGHPCAAFPKEVFLEVGMEREDILRGLDPDLRVRIRRAGYRIVLAPNTWAYHPLPDSFLKFIRLFLRNGYGSAFLQVFHPEIVYDTDETLESKQFVPRRPFWYRLFRYPVRLLKSLVSGQWLRFLGFLFYSVGYLGGLVRFSLRKNAVSEDLLLR